MMNLCFDFVAAILIPFLTDELKETFLIYLIHYKKRTLVCQDNADIEMLCVAASTRRDEPLYAVTGFIKMIECRISGRVDL